MSPWRDDAWLKYAFAAFLGMIAGVAAKQAVAIQSGVFPKPISVLADFLVLGMVFLMSMYLHQWKPQIPMEGIAFFAAAMAMWGPKGIAALISRLHKGALSAAESLAQQVLRPVEPVHRPTVMEGVDREREMAFKDENKFGQTAPVRRMRDVIPLEKVIPADMTGLLEGVDKADLGEDAEDNKGG